MYEIDDDDSPSVVLDKVQQSVHDSICGMFKPVKVNSFVKGNESYDSKNTSTNQD